MLLYATDYPSLQAALDAADDGDRVYVPSGIWPVPSSGAFRITASIELFGDGPGTPPNPNGTVFIPSASGQDVFSIEPQASPGANSIANVHLHDFKIQQNPTTGTRPQRGIVCTLGTGKRVDALRIDRVVAINMLGDGIHVEGANTTDTYVDRLVIEHSASNFCGGYGAYLKYVRHLITLRVECGGNVTGGMYCEKVGACFYASGFEGNGPATPGTTTVRSLHLSDCSIASLDACRFEAFIYGNVKVACRLEQCRGATQVAACVFVYPGPDVDPNQQDSTGIEVPAGSGPVNIMSCGFSRVHPNIIKIDTTDTGAVVWSQFNFVEPNNIKPGGISGPIGNNRGLLSHPYVRRQGTQAIPDSIAGIIVPALTADPTSVVQNGMLYYNTSITKLRARIANQWKSVDIAL